MIVHSQKLFNYYKDTLHLTDIHRAVGTLLKYGWSFSSRGTSYGFDARISPKSLIDRVTKLRERFANP